jgi:phosphoglycerate dehydrogenase-like enzyme
MLRMRLAILDDYQRTACAMADCDSLRPGIVLQAFHDTLSNEDAVVERLRDFDIVVAMRERTPFPRSLLERLPRLQLLITTSMRNASIDVKAAVERGIVVSGTGMLRYPTMELSWGLILALARNIVREDGGMRKGDWQTTLGVGLSGRCWAFWASGIWAVRWPESARRSRWRSLLGAQT